jgi:hypothetical protein
MEGFATYRVEFREKFITELETWITDRGYGDALTLFAAFLAKQITEGADAAAIESMQIAWEQAADNSGVNDEPPDYETQMAAREHRDYEDGKAEANQRRAERLIYGDELAEQFHLQDDLNRFNRGEDD